MQKQILEFLKNVQQKPIDCPEYSELDSNIHDEDFQQNLINIVFNEQLTSGERILVISVIKTFHGVFSNQILEPLFTLLLDATIQYEIANLFICSFDIEYTNETILPFLQNKILNEPSNLLLLNGAIYCYSEYVEKYKTRNDDIIQILLKIFSEYDFLQDEFKIISINTIIKQMALTPPEDEEVRNEDLSIITQLFVSLNLENINIKIIEFLLAFINEKVYYLDSEDSSYESLLQKFIDVLDMIVSMFPISKDQHNITTPLYYLFRIWIELNIQVPFEKIFPILLIEDDQMNSIENDLDYSFRFLWEQRDINEEEDKEEMNEQQEFDYSSSILDEADEYSSDKQQENNEEEGNEKKDYDYSSGIPEEYSFDDESMLKMFNSYYWEKKAWKFLERVETLSETQIITRLYIISRDVEYVKNAIATCFENINQSPSYNFAVILLLKDVSSALPFDFDPSEFETFGSRIIQYYLLEYCNSKILQKYFDDFNDESDIFFNFMKNMNLRDFADSMLSSDEPIYILCMFKFIIEGPREFIDTDIYIAVLFKTLTIVLPNLTYNDDKKEVLEKVFDYLSPGNSITDKKANYVISFDRSIREQKSKSIFCLKEEIINAFNEVKETFFGQVLFSTIINNIQYSDICIRIAKIIKYFEGGDIPKYITRHNSADESSNEETIVDISNYGIFFPVIIQLFQELMQYFSTENNLNIDSFFTLFAKTFINIYIPNDESITSIIDTMHETFVNMNHEELKQLKPTTMNLVLRIFFKYGKLEKLDYTIFNLCQLQKEYINSLVYEISLILINQNQVFSEEIVQEFSIYLRNILKGYSRFFSKSIICILARVALYDRERLELILFGENIEEFLLNIINEISIMNFKEYRELEQRMIIGLFFSFSQIEQLGNMSKDLLKATLESLDKNFTDPSNEIGVFPITSSFGLIKENTFYDDLEFISHPLISCSLSELIHGFQADEIFPDFLKKYPQL